MDANGGTNRRMTKVISFKDRASLHEAATQRIAGELMEEAVRCDAPSLLLSGGSTPGPVYEALSQTDLPWEKVTVGLVDERWVDEGDSGSNAALVKRTLLKNLAGDAKFVPMKTEHDDPFVGQAAVQSAYDDVVNECSFAVLGMGTDGHVCSWFPDSKGLEAAVAPDSDMPVQAIEAQRTEVTGSYLERMTLTLGALKRCKSVLLLITGEAKKSVLDKALNGSGMDLPVSHLLSLPSDKLTIFYAP